MSNMKDALGRTIDYMRISITDRCNLRCKYCMPYGVECVPRWDILSLEEIQAVGICAAGLGIRHIKVTGGEPLVRRDCCQLVKQLKSTPGIEKVTITTNGVLLERYLDDMSNYWKSVICVGSGNEGTSAGHTSGMLKEREEQRVELGVQQREPALNVQLWKSYVDEVDISVIGPSGVRVGPISERLGTQRFRIGGTEILLYYGKPSPYQTNQEIYFDFIPTGSYIDSGVWQIVLTPRKVVTGIYQMWLPSQSVLNQGTAFLNPVSSDTLTIPSTASRVVTVGAYDARSFSYADFSGRGALEKNAEMWVQKPDLAAPGVRVTTAKAGGGYGEYSGTSFAVPFVTGSAALLMEWGIIRGNDPYLYGEKVKAYLRRGARHLPGYEQWPNNQLGYGVLCVEESLPF